MKFTFAPETKPLDGYTIKRAIDRGGFGEVYYALSDSGKEVALKLIQQNEETELRGVAQCLNLKHPNLVTLFDVRQDRDGDHWIVMEYVSGKGLDQVIAERPAGMTPAEIDPWLEGIAAGIAYLHDRGIVHRDVKPANIFREHNVVKVGDVGLSKFMSPSKRSAQTESVGTVYYMAPEVARGRYGPEVDVYSLGVIVYEMLTGRVPFDGESSAEILMKHLTQPPDLNVPEITPAMRPVLANAFAKDPQHRTRSVTQLLNEFRQAVSGKKVAQEIPPEAFVANGASQPAPRSTTQQAWPIRSFLAPSLTGRRQKQFAGLPWLLVLGMLPTIWIVERSPMLAGPYLIAVVGAIVFILVKVNQTPGEAGTAAIQWQRKMNDIHSGLSEWRGPILLVLTVVLAAFSRRTIFRGIPFSEALFVLGGSGVMAWVAYRVTLHLVRQFGGALAPVSQPMATSATVAASPRVNPTARTVTPVVVQRRPQFVPAARHLDPTTVRPVAFRDRCVDLTHSMIAAVFFTALFTPLVGWLTPLFGDGNTWPGDLGSWGLFSVTTLLSSWGVLLHSKLWEGRPADNWFRRLTALALGAGVGAAAYSMHDLLLVHMNYDLLDATPVLTNLGSRSLLTTDVQPTLTGFMAFFGGLFAVRRWWWLADAFRSNRLRIASVVMTSVLAGAVCVVFGFHATWGVTWATVTACVVQLAAVWVPDNVRRNGIA
jgi:hypothetical protein